MVKKSKTKKFFIGVFYFFTLSSLLIILISSLLFIYFAKDLPRPERFMDIPVAEPTKIYDRTGEHVLYTIYGEERRTPVPLSEVSDNFIKALLAAEDYNFYNHFGIDFRGIARSALENIRMRDTVAGGSTISQQLIRSAFLTREKTYMRKTREIILTIELERRYSKDEILEFYLNQVPFGQNAYGVESAANTYFDKKAKDLSLAESAVLVSLLPSPSMLSPFGENADELMRRKDVLLNRMKEVGFITETEKEEAKEEVIDFSNFSNYLQAPHFIMHIKGYLENKYGEDFLKEKGLNIYTTIDFDMQKEAEEIIKAGAKNNTQYNAHNASLVAIDPNTGEILAMVGSADYFKEPYPSGCVPGSSCLFEPYTNTAMSNRQPGSAFKPFAYAVAFEEGYDDKTTVIDEKTNFGTVRDPYIPRNYDGRFRGEVTLRESLAQSLNIPSVKVLKAVGVENVINKVHNMGITTLKRGADFYGLPLVLGGGDVKLLEITSAYGTFSTGGYHTPTLSISKITDNKGEIIEKNENTPRRVLSSSAANLINDILSDDEARSPMFGAESPLHFKDHNVSVKTGTTQEFRDGWTIGYTPDIVVGVWAGNNNNMSMTGGESMIVAAPIWRMFMESFLN